MKPHVKLYLKANGFTVADFIPCECCGNKAVDIHHLSCRGMGGSKEKDSRENLVALCRACHLEYGDKKQYREFLVKKHQEFMQQRNAA